MAVIPSGTVVRAIWRDSKSLSGWVSLAHPFAPGVVSSIGYVVKSDEEGLTLANSIAETPRAACSPFTIPTGAIEEWEVLDGLSMS